MQVLLQSSKLTNNSFLKIPENSKLLFRHGITSFPNIPGVGTFVVFVGENLFNEAQRLNTVNAVIFFLFSHRVCHCKILQKNATKL